MKMMLLQCEQEGDRKRAVIGGMFAANRCNRSENKTILKSSVLNKDIHERSNH